MQRFGQIAYRLKTQWDILRGRGFSFIYVTCLFILSCVVKATPLQLNRLFVAYFPHIPPQRFGLLNLIWGVPLQLMWIFIATWNLPNAEPLTLTHTQKPPVVETKFKSWLLRIRTKASRLLRKLSSRLTIGIAIDEMSNQFAESGMAKKVWTVMLPIALLILIGLMSVLVGTPLSLSNQLFLGASMILASLVLSLASGAIVGQVMALLAIIATTRYLWWRLTATLNWQQPFDLFTGFLLFTAEAYAWLVMLLGFFQCLVPLGRRPIPMPQDPRKWPVVDILIPTYNESLAILKPTVFGAKGIDWPEDKLRIHILDDGNRAEIREFAANAHVNYVIRSDNRHAKAGNLNHALKDLTGDLVAIFDCDHIPTRAFLQLTVGWFMRDEKLALMQTPHHYFSPDPFERNLGHFRAMPNEGKLYYGIIQEGNDFWNAAMFCGSNAILRRSAINSIGGFATETITEDAHTSLRLHAQGFNSAYLSVPLAAGLAAESLGGHILQRLRWAVGMTQILRKEFPLCNSKLNWGQRLCYFSSMLHFLSGFPRLLFLTAAPLLFLIINSYMITAEASLILAYATPHLMLSLLATSRYQNAYRRPFWGQIYEIVLAWTIAIPTLKALINPGPQKFHVTAKGESRDKDSFAWKLSKPLLTLILINFVGIVMGVYRLGWGSQLETANVWVNIAWTLYNLFILGAAIAVAKEIRQRRDGERVGMSARLPAKIRTAAGIELNCDIKDFSATGAQIKVSAHTASSLSNHFSLVLIRSGIEVSVPCIINRRVVDSSDESVYLGIAYQFESLQQEMMLIQATFGRADNWARWTTAIPTVSFWQNFCDVCQTSVQGYHGLWQSFWSHPKVLHLLSPIKWIRKLGPYKPVLAPRKIPSFSPPRRSIEGI